MITSEQALQRLKDGNFRFVSGQSNQAKFDPAKNEALVSGQQPFATILACSDSRVPPEQVFDQGLGDLFVIRVAGNIVDSTAIASIEYAVAMLGSRLIVTMGHMNCGGVRAAIASIRNGARLPSQDMEKIVARVRAAIEGTVQSDTGGGPALLESCIRSNAKHSAEQLTQQSAIIRKHVADKGLSIVSAYYSLETGAVDFMD